jgi:hypothetical protein
MKRPLIALLVAVFVVGSAATLHAQKNPKPTPKVSHPAKPVKTTTPAMTAKPVKTTTKSVNAAKPVKSTKPVNAAKTTKPIKADKPAKPKSVTVTTTTTTSTSSTSATTVVLSPVQQKLQKNVNLADKLRTRLPLGTNLMLAAEGFRNLGQFVAAVNVSHNLNIPFDQLKTSMVTDGNSLGQSIKALRPVSSVTVEVQRAEYQARGMILESEKAPVTTTTTTTTTSTTTSRKPKKPVKTPSAHQ